MHISFNQRWEKTANVNGFGYAREMCEKSLIELGHTVNFADSTADVEINFIQPEHWVWSGVDYRIAYLPWESTQLKEGWLESLNNDVDEVWTPSPVVAEWFVDAGVKKPVFVYEHGVDAIWKTKMREWNGETFNVFHHGADAVRKGFRETIECFNEVFLGKDAEINFKMTMNGFNVRIPNTNIIQDRLSTEELVDLYHRQHLMVYPSWGEGFGLAPLQAIATGLPTMITKGWAPYEYLLPEQYLISTELVDSPWPEIHPGKMLKPNYEELVEKATNIYNFSNYEESTRYFFGLSMIAKKDFSWVDKTEKAFAHLV